ncbi:MAG TPA: hypothetical protein VGI65_20670 [Steroidobacteraceae bacterium]
MRRTKALTAVVIAGCMGLLSACATTISEADLMRPNYGLNPHPIVLLDPPYVTSGQSGFSVTQAPCLPSSYRCTPQAQIQWAENAFH